MSYGLNSYNQFSFIGRSKRQSRAKVHLLDLVSANPEINMRAESNTMDDINRVTNQYGRQDFPRDGRCVYGARWIWPDEALWDRQSFSVDSTQDEMEADFQKRELLNWLNGKVLRKPVKALGIKSTDNYTPFQRARMVTRHWKDRSLMTSSNANCYVIYEDKKGIMIGSCQGSYGYLYVCAYLKEKPIQAKDKPKPAKKKVCG